MKKALIVEDGFGPHPLAAARSLGRAGWTVGIGSPVRSGLAVSSRWARRWHEVPPAEVDAEAFLAATRRAIDDGGYDIVFGADDIEVLALSDARATLAACVPYGRHEAVLAAIDKRSLTQAASEAGLAVPLTADATPAGIDAVGWPVVVKARLHWAPGMRAVPARLPPRTCKTADEVWARVGEIRSAGGEPFLQARIEGGLMALSVVLDGDGRLVARAQQRATRESPYWLNSVRAETVRIDDRLCALVAVMLQRIGWRGLANVQFLESANGDANLIDLNGRFYGSIGLAIAAGVDLPVLWAETALGRSGLPLRSARVGVRYQALEEDLRRAAVEHRGGLAADFVDCLRYAPGAVHSTWSLYDPMPTLRRAARTARARVPSFIGRGS